MKYLSINKMPYQQQKRVLQRSQQRRTTRRLVTGATVLLLICLLMLATGCASQVQTRCAPLKPTPAPALSQSPSTIPYSTQWQKLEEESRAKLINGRAMP